MPDPDDHRSLAQRLDLCHFAEHAPGTVYWHPRGYVLYRLLERAARSRVEADGYFEVRTPQLVRRPVWNTSGHWDSFASGMFRLHDGSFDAALKPVSCPGHISVAKQMVDSYRDLPLRLAEFGIVHRDEPGGTLRVAAPPAVHPGRRSRVLPGGSNRRGARSILRRHRSLLPRVRFRVDAGGAFNASARARRGGRGLGSFRSNTASGARSAWRLVRGPGGMRVVEGSRNQQRRGSRVWEAERNQQQRESRV